MGPPACATAGACLLASPSPPPPGSVLLEWCPYTPGEVSRPRGGLSGRGQRPSSMGTELFEPQGPGSHWRAGSSPCHWDPGSFPLALSASFPIFPRPQSGPPGHRAPRWWLPVHRWPTRILDTDPIPPRSPRVQRPGRGRSVGHPAGPSGDSFRPCQWALSDGLAQLLLLCNRLMIHGGFSCSRRPDGR